MRGNATRLVHSLGASLAGRQADVLALPAPLSAAGAPTQCSGSCVYCIRRSIFLSQRDSCSLSGSRFQSPWSRFPTRDSNPLPVPSS